MFQKKNLKELSLKVLVNRQVSTLMAVYGIDGMDQKCNKNENVNKQNENNSKKQNRPIALNNVSIMQRIFLSFAYFNNYANGKLTHNEKVTKMKPVS